MRHIKKLTAKVSGYRNRVVTPNLKVGAGRVTQRIQISPTLKCVLSGLVCSTMTPTKAQGLICSPGMI